jgi:hypothetical protein
VTHLVHHVAVDDGQPLCAGRTHEGAIVVGDDRTTPVDGRAAVGR